LKARTLYHLENAPARPVGHVFRDGIESGRKVRLALIGYSPVNRVLRPKTKPIHHTKALKNGAPAPGAALDVYLAISEMVLRLR